MKNLSVLLVFVFALVGVFSTLQAEARSQIRVAPAAFTAPVPLSDPADAVAEANKKKKKKKDKDSERDEEEVHTRPALHALELVDPGALEFVARMNLVAAGR